MNMRSQPPMSEKQIRLLKAADMIQDLRPHQFDMTSWSMCIAGHVSRMVNRFNDNNSNDMVAGPYLMLTAGEQAKLFMPHFGELFPEYADRAEEYTALNLVSRAWAARTIRHLAYTGRVDWQATRTDTPAIIVSRMKTTLVDEPV